MPLFQLKKTHKELFFFFFAGGWGGGSGLEAVILDKDI